MKHPYRILFVLLLTAIFLRPGNPCSFPDSEDIFTQQSDPDAPYGKFVAGRLGILETTYRVRHLLVAYNTLSGRGLSPSEQKAALAAESFYNSSEDTNANAPANQDQKPGTGHALWNDVYVERKVPGNDYQTFANCLDDAFANADATLADRRAHYARPGQPDPPEIANWIAGQQAVFSNCPGAGQTPQPAPDNAPLWLRQDRAYQSAAAAFYNLDYSTALTDFRAIAADHASPWSPLAHYLIARTYIRKALVPYSFTAETPEKIEASNAAVRVGLAQARDQLQSILRDPAMEPLHAPSGHLLDYVMLRLDPAAQAGELARRLTESKPARSSAAAPDPDYLQNVIDLTFAYNSMQLYSARPAPKSANTTAQSDATPKPRQPLIRWLSDLGRNPVGSPPPSFDARRADALASWRATHAPQWLVAALSIADPGSSDSADLIAAARAVPATSPAFPSVTYHRLRLAAAAPAQNASSTTQPVYAELSALMPRIENIEPRSTINLFADLQSSLSPTLNDYLKNATRLPASYGEGEPLPTPTTSVTLCGVNVLASDARHLDAETALIFNQRMSLHMLRDAALSPVLPGNVRLQLAHMAWTRALLLDDPETARALSPYLGGCQPTFKQWLDQYNAAATPGERHVLGLLALMRFTSTEPTVRAGIERDFASYTEYRDNWWCSNSGYNPQPQPPGQPQPLLFSGAIVPLTQQPDPPFLSEADRAAVNTELARLEKIPSASDYFALQALDWVKQHPADPHNADVLGFAMRVVRNACRSDATKELNHQLFDTLHRRYPKSEWALRYTTWE